MNRLFHHLGAFIGRHPRSVLFAWAIAIGLGVWGAAKFQIAAQSGTSGLYGSPSNAVTEALRSEFSNPFLEPLIVVASSPRLTIEDNRLLRWDEEAARSLRALPVVKEVAAYADHHAPQLRSPGGHETILLVGLKATDVPGQQ